MSYEYRIVEDFGVFFIREVDLEAGVCSDANPLCGESVEEVTNALLDCWNSLKKPVLQGERLVIER